MSLARIIKKYPNRRLYDTEISSYITLEDVRQLIVDGERFVVRDAKTGEDLTRCVMLQIIAEHEDQGSPMFSTQMLSHVIRFYGDALQSAMGSYMERCVEEFSSQQHALRRQLGSLAGQSPWTLLNQISSRDSDSGKPAAPSGLVGNVVPGTKPGDPKPRG